MDIKIDKIDEQILSNLQRYDAPRTATEMAEELGVSPSTVRRRVNRLRQSGIVSIIALVDPEKVGLSVVAIIGINVVVKKIETVTQVLRNRTEITWLATSIGKFNIMAMARFSSNETLAEFVQTVLPNVKGITGVETFLCIQEIKTVRVTR